jgi:hypothetical protein
MHVMVVLGCFSSSRSEQRGAVLTTEVCVTKKLSRKGHESVPVVRQEDQKFHSGRGMCVAGRDYFQIRKKKKKWNEKVMVGPGLWGLVKKPRDHHHHNVMLLYLEIDCRST